MSVFGGEPAWTSHKTCHAYNLCDRSPHLQYFCATVVESAEFAAPQSRGCIQELSFGEKHLE